MATNIKVGDRVKFLDDVGEGKITKIIDTNTVLVETAEGFEFPYPVSQLIVISSEQDYEHATQGEITTTDQKKSFFDFDEPDIIKDNEETNIYLAIVPQNPYQISDTKFDLYLVNDSNWHLAYIYQLPEDKLVRSTPGHLGPNLLELLCTYSAEDIKQVNEIVFQLLFFRRTPHQLRKPLFVRIRLKAEKIMTLTSYIDNDYFETKALFYHILEEHPLEEAIEKLQKHDFHRVKQEKEVKNKRLNQPRQFKSGKKPDLWEIDLHITELLDDTRGMSAKDMLEYQMQVFKDKLEEGMRDPNVKKIVFIHGKGNGRLRQEIRAYLDRKKIPYQDASFARYGFGATLVFVSQTK